MKVLYTSAELHDAIKHVLGSPTKGERRVVLVAYLGAQAEAFLPSPQGLQIVCSMEPGSTSETAIARLRSRGAKVRQSDRLHMKVYWSSKKGAVICSANASSNALGRGSLKESGVLLDVGAVKIEKLLSYAKPRSISKKDLNTLGEQSDRLRAQGIHRPGRSNDDALTLADWLSSASPKKWKLGWWDTRTPNAKSAIEESKKMYGVREPHSSVDGAKNDFHKGNWALSFNADTGREAAWIYVDFVVRINPSDKRAYFKAYPYQATQVHAAARYSSPPFRLDTESRRAIAKAVAEMGKEAFEHLTSAKVPVRFIRLLKKHSA